MKSAGYQTIGGVIAPDSAPPSSWDIGVFNGQKYIWWERSDRLRRAGHQHWIITGSSFAYLGDTQYYAQPLLDTSGVVYIVKWNDWETAQGVYAVAAMQSALDYCAARGKKLIIRFVWKSYQDAAAVPAPAYVVADPATYGGDPGKGGLRRVYSDTAPIGWGARLENAALLARFKAAISAFGQFKTHFAFAGFMFDESTWSCFAVSAMPDGLTKEIILSAVKDYYAHAASVFAGYDVYPNVNYVEGEASEGIEVLYQEARDLSAWCIAHGMRRGITDTYPQPRALSRFMQPVYAIPPDATTTLVHVDYLSMGNDDAGLTQRMIDCATQTARIGADITVWYVKGGAASNWWAAAKNAMQVVG